MPQTCHVHCRAIHLLVSTGLATIFARWLSASGKVQYLLIQCLPFNVFKFSVVCNGSGACRVALDAMSECFIVYAINARYFSKTRDLFLLNTLNNSLLKYFIAIVRLVVRPVGCAERM